ncbi:hypothetical protein [Roseateles sp.]|jgi:hypothetical protein
MKPDQPDLFAPKPQPVEPRLGDCFLCCGERMCDHPELCYPPQLPEERRL